MKLRLVGAAGLLFVGALAVVIALFGPALGSTDQSQYITSAATRADVINQVTAGGTLAAATTYGLSFGAHPRIVTDSSSANAGSGSWLVESVEVEVGQHVTAGDVLATADTTAADQALVLAQANLAVAQARYDTDAVGTTESERESLRIALDQATQGVTNAISSRDDTIGQNNIHLSQSNAALRDAKRELADDEDAGAPDSVIGADKAAVQQAADALELLEAQVDGQNRRASEQVASARLALQSAQNNYDNQTAPVADSDLVSDQAAVLQAQQAVTDAQATVDAATLRTNADGIVVAVNVVTGALAPNDDAVRVRTLDLVVSADVAESDLPSLAVGQSATVIITATGDQLNGTVSAIAPASSVSTGDSVVSYGVTVELSEVPDSVRPGMSAQVAVTVAEASNVLAVPAIALNGGAGNYTVRLLDAEGGVSVRVVEVGLVTSNLAEINSGLAEGDSVITGTTSSLNSTGTNGGPGGGGLQGAPGGGRFQGPGGGTVITP
jgi:macrolide-specific efflux system membrane fusion protein